MGVCVREPRPVLSFRHGFFLSPRRPRVRASVSGAVLFRVGVVCFGGFFPPALTGCVCVRELNRLPGADEHAWQMFVL